jgi:YVTN family beta-propeller protein
LWNPTSNKVYCANTQDGTVSVVSGETNEVIATVPVADYPDVLAWNSRLNKVYCASGESDRLNVIDGEGDSLIRMVTLSDYPSAMVYNETMNKLYVACHDNDRIAVLDAGPDTVIRYIPARGVGALLWSPATNRVFCCGADTIKVIDCLTDEIAVRMQGGGDVWCYNPVNELVYLAARHSMYVLSPYGDSVVAQVPGWAYDVAAVPFPNKVYASGSAAGIQVIDGASNLVVDTIPVVVGEMVCDTAKGKVYCSNFNTQKADIIDARADTLIKTIPLGRYPEFLCWNRTNSRVYINDFMDNVLYVIRDTSTGISERTDGATVRPRAATTVTCGRLFYESSAPGNLVDACGRIVAALKPGHNDICALTPGVYAVVTADGGSRRRIIKVR